MFEEHGLYGMLVTRKSDYVPGGVRAVRQTAMRTCRTAGRRRATWRG